MNILFAVPYVPNLIRVRPYSLIRSLSQRGNRVTVMTMWTGEAEKQSIEPLRKVCQRVVALELPKWRSYLNCLAALPSATPLQAAYCWQPAFAEAVLAETQRLENGRPAYDVVHVEHLRGARFGLHLKSSLSSALGPPVVWDSVDCITHLFRQSSAGSKKRLSRWMTRFELGRTEKYEGWLVDQFDRVLVTSRLDREALLGLRKDTTPGTPVHVLPNGVDLEYFTSGDAEREPATLVISGKMSYHANVSMVMYFTNRILPLIQAKRPDARLVVVGKDPPAEIMALGNQPNIEVTGTVKDIRPYLQKATVAVAPLTYGAGIQNKVLEAMACGTPVVTTPKAVAALEITPGRELLVGETEAQFAEAVLKLLNQPEERRQIGMNGRLYVEKCHHWSDIAAQLERIYAESAVRSG